MRIRKKTITCILIVLLIWVLILGASFSWFYVNFYLLPTHPYITGENNLKQVWVYKTEDQIIATPVIFGPNIILRTNKSLYSINANTSETNWISNSPSPTGVSSNLSLAPVVSGDTIIVSENNSIVAAFNATTGNTIWRSDSIQADTRYHKIALIDSIIIQEQIVYVGRFGWNLTAYKLLDGKILWERDISNRTSPFLSVNHSVIYLSNGINLQVIDKTSGSMIWQELFDHLLGRIITDDNNIYLTMPIGETEVIVLDKKTHQKKWQLTRDKLDTGKLITLELHGDTLYVGGDRLTAISKNDGRILWSTEKLGPFETPVFLNDTIYIRNRQKKLFMLDINNGKPLGSITIRANTPMSFEPERGPVVVDDMIIVPFGDNRLYAYRP